MFARWQSDPADLRTAVCAGAAVVAHAVFFASAALGARPPSAHMTDAIAFFDAIVEKPAFAMPIAAADATEPAPPPPLPPVTIANAPARAAAVGDPYDDPIDRGREAAAAAVAAARAIFTSDDPSAFSAATNPADQGPGFGIVAGDATGDDPTFERAAIIGGQPAGKHTGKGIKKAHPGEGTADEGPDRSRRTAVFGGLAEDCEFPDAANGINQAVVVVVVAVRPDGRASQVVVASDPGHGFGAAARACAMRRRYEPARDHDGRPVAGLTPPTNVRFTR